MVETQRLVALEGIVAALRKLEDHRPGDREVILDAIEAALPLLTQAPHGGALAQPLPPLAA